MMSPPAPSLPSGKTAVLNVLDAESLLELAGWRPFRAGIDILPLYGTLGEHESSAALLRYRPGASVPTHEHPDYEHVVVLKGSQRDAVGTYRRGTLVINSPGSRHAVTSDDGCVVLVIWNRPVAFVPDEHDPDASEGERSWQP